MNFYHGGPAYHSDKSGVRRGHAITTGLPSLYYRAWSVRPLEVLSRDLEAVVEPTRSANWVLHIMGSAGIRSLSGQLLRNLN